jgi:hypothetical protein
LVLLAISERQLLAASDPRLEVRKQRLAVRLQYGEAMPLLMIGPLPGQVQPSIDHAERLAMAAQEIKDSLGPRTRYVRTNVKVFAANGARLREDSGLLTTAGREKMAAIVSHAALALVRLAAPRGGM